MPFYGRTNQEVTNMILRSNKDTSGLEWEHISLEAKELVKKMLVKRPS